MEWKEVRLGDVCSIQRGASPRPIQKFISKEGMPWVKIADATGISSRYINSTSEYIIKEGVSKSRIVYPGDLIVSNSATPGLPKFMAIEACVHDGWLIIRDFDGIDKVFLYYVFLNIRRRLSNQANGSVFMNLKTDIVKDFVIKLPTLDDQHRIASILSSLDRKIELNNKINADLEEMAQAIFKNWFVDFEPFKDGKFVDSELGMIPEGWKVGRADDFYQINIGKTPPRKEHKWFSNNPADKIWVSIANMGNSGIFISDSSEYLTKEAVDRHNIIMVPRNTILLSFKLTVGRVAIADKELTTNEAIARFILSDDKYMEYLYLYLKKYDYNSLGSTSSIATAVNSKTIKGMQMLQPSDKIIDAFHIQVNPIFEKIRSLTKESSRLSLLRDTLLPRLMSGELEVPE